MLQWLGRLHQALRQIRTKLASSGIAWHVKSDEFQRACLRGPPTPPTLSSTTLASPSASSLMFRTLFTLCGYSYRHPRYSMPPHAHVWTHAGTSWIKMGHRRTATGYSLVHIAHSLHRTPRCLDAPPKHRNRACFDAGRKRLYFHVLVLSSEARHCVRLGALVKAFALGVSAFILFLLSSAS